MVFGGVKIFDTEGGVLKEFKAGISAVFSVSFRDKNVIDLSNKDEIYVRDVDEKTNTSIAVFDMDGKKLRQIIPVDANRAKDAKQWVSNTHFGFRIDKNGDIVILYTKKGVLKKIGGNGKLIWERNLYDDLPKEDKNIKQFEIKNTKRMFQVTYRLDFYGFCLTETGDIFVSAHKGGIYYDADGNPLFILKRPSGKGFGPTLIWYKNDVLTPNRIFKSNNKIGRNQ